MAELELDGIVKDYGNFRAIDGVDLKIDDGDFCVFVGPSGCGKSTLLRLIAGLEEISAGELRIDGERVNEQRASDRGLAMVFQTYALYPHMTVWENLAFGLENIKTPKEELKERVARAARMLQIDELLDRRPKQLSGGQRQRVAIGRAVVREPRVFLFDEPLSNLDAELRISTRAELSALHKRLATTMIYVTHDQVEAMTLADRIVVLRSGRIEQIGRPLDLYNEPANLFVAGFIGAPRMNLLPVKVSSVKAGKIVVEGPGGLKVDIAAKGDALNPGDEATLGIRPHDIGIANGDKGGVEAEVTLVEALGPETVVHAVMPDEQKLVAVVGGQDIGGNGKSVRFSLDSNRVHLFDGAGLRVNPHQAEAR